MDSTHSTNMLKWKLFTVVVRDEHRRWIPCAHMLSEYEDGDIVEAFLRKIKQWCGGRGGWNLRHMVTDSSAAEQRGVRKAFRGLYKGETEVDHWLCQKHSERSLKRALGADNCKQSYEHLYNVGNQCQP